MVSKSHPILRIGGPYPNDKAKAKLWAEQRDFIDFLHNERTSDTVTLYASVTNGSSLVLRSALVHARVAKAIDIELLDDWDGGANDSWSCHLVTGGSKRPRMQLTSPQIIVGGNVLASATPVIFFRSFDGRTEDKAYYEVAQFFTHAHNLHWTPERRAWCRIDENGDIQDVIRWATADDGSGSDCVIIERETLEKHLLATNTVLLQFFDSTRHADPLLGWDKATEHRHHDHDHAFRMRIAGARASFIRGTQIIRAQRNTNEYAADLVKQLGKPKRYETFITHDWKNKQVAEASCDPAQLASYFQADSSLPFEMSPVFFGAGVLDKYKADPEKYTIDARSIDCRNAWHLSAYAITDKGQVQSYLCYLGDLPYTEQLYWKSFNEPPKGPISDRTLKTDFMGQFDTEPEPLRDLLSEVRRLQEAKVAWFTVREPDLLKQIHYPITSSTKIWGEVLTSLAKLVIEALEKKHFERVATKLGAVIDEQTAKWGSIRWAEEALRRMGVEEDTLAEIIEPLRTTQFLRTKFNAHAGGAEANTLRASLLKEHGSPRAHIESICGQLAHALERLRVILGAG